MRIQDKNLIETVVYDYVASMAANPENKNKKGVFDADNFASPHGRLFATTSDLLDNDSFYANNSTFIAETNDGSVYFTNTENKNGSSSNVKTKDGLDFSDLDDMIRTLTGKTAESNYEFEMGEDSIYEIDTKTQTLDKTNSEFSISGNDIKGLLDAVKNGEKLEDVTENFLLQNYGGDEASVLKNLSDNANANNLDAFDQLVNKLSGDIKNSFINKEAVNTKYSHKSTGEVYNVSLDIDTYKGLNVSKDIWNGIDLELIGGNGGSYGDPHFTMNGKQVFDFQGEDDKVYQYLDNKDVNIVSKFNGDKNVTVVSDQNLNLKGTNIEVESHMNGTFEVYKTDEKGNRNQIGDQTNYKDAEIQNALKDKGVNLDFANNKLSVTYKNKTINQELAGGCINNSIDNSLLINSTGLAGQLIGAMDTDGLLDGIAHFDANNDGKEDTVNYDINNQYFLNEGKGHKRGVLSDDVKSAIEADFNNNTNLPPTQRYNRNSTVYTLAQWIEYLGSKLFEVSYSDTESNPFAA